MLGRSLLLGSNFLSLLAFLALLAEAAPANSDVLLASREKLSSSAPSIPRLVRRDPDPNKNNFITPAPNGVPNDFSNDTVYDTGSQIIEVEWISEWQTVDLQICQPTTGPTYGCYTLIRGTLSKGFHWPVANVTDHMSGFGSSPIPNVYYFQLAETNTLNPSITSHYFDIAKGANDTTTGGETAGSNNANTSTASSATPAATGSASAIASGSTVSLSTPLGSSGSSNSSGFSSLSTPSQVAIYVLSAAVGAGLCGAGIFWLVLRERRKRQATKLAKIAITDSVSTLTSPIPLQEMHSDTFVHETGNALPHEISSHEVPMELPAEVPGLAISRYDDDVDTIHSDGDTMSQWSHHAQPHDSIG